MELILVERSGATSPMQCRCRRPLHSECIRKRGNNLWAQHILIKSTPTKASNVYRCCSCWMSVCVWYLNNRLNKMKFKKNLEDRSGYVWCFGPNMCVERHKFSWANVIPLRLWYDRDHYLFMSMKWHTSRSISTCVCILIVNFFVRIYTRWSWYLCVCGVVFDATRAINCGKINQFKEWEYIVIQFRLIWFEKKTPTDDR